MGAAFGWGTLAASSLVIGAVIALAFRISTRRIGLVMGFGAGVLISAVAFDLVEEAVEMETAHWAPPISPRCSSQIFPSPYRRRPGWH